MRLLFIYLFSLLLMMVSKPLKAQHNFAWPNFSQAGEVRNIYQQSIRFKEGYSTSFDGGSYIGIGNNAWTRMGFRGGIKKDLNPFYSVELGLMYNHVSSDIETVHEYRPHQSLHINYPRFAHSVIKHRIQLEERFINANNITSPSFCARLRYQISNEGSFKNQAVGPKSFYYRTSLEWNINVYNEINGKTLLRGRYGLGYGYQFNSQYSFDITYFLEHNAMINTRKHSMTHIFQITLKHTIRL